MHRHHDFHGGHEHRGRHPWASHMAAHIGGRGPQGRHRGGRIGRFLEHGDLRFIVLALIAEQPRHGYELIKELEDRTGGAYRPSPGVIYPTLALLEDEGFIRPAAGEAGRKLYEATDEGRAALAANQAGLGRASVAPWPTWAWPCSSAWRGARSRRRRSTGSSP